MIIIPSPFKFSSNFAITFLVLLTRLVDMAIFHFPGPKNGKDRARVRQPLKRSASSRFWKETPYCRSGDLTRVRRTRLAWERSYEDLLKCRDESAAIRLLLRDRLLKNLQGGLPR